MGYQRGIPHCAGWSEEYHYPQLACMLPTRLRHAHICTMTICQFLCSLRKFWLNLRLMPCLELPCLSTLTKGAVSILKRCILPSKGFSTVANMKICDRNSHLISDPTLVSTLCPKTKSLGGDMGRERYRLR